MRAICKAPRDLRLREATRRPHPHATVAAIRARQVAMRRASSWIGALVAALVLAGAAAAQQPAPVNRGPGEREALIVNETGLTLRELYVFPSGAADFGVDRLGTDTIATGQQFRARLGRFNACFFDVRAVFAGGGVETRARVDLCATRRVTFGDPTAPNREALLVNDTDLVLREIFAFAPGAASLGPDRLGAEVIAPGESFRLRLGRTRDCVFSLLATYEDGRTERRERVDLCRTPRVAFGDPTIPWREGEARNASGATILRLFARRAEAEGWGPDRLGAAVLRDGAAFPLRLRVAECRLDLRAEYEGGEAEERLGHDICATPVIVFDGSRIPRPPLRSFVLINRHGASVAEFYASGTQEEEWGPDRLRGELVRGGRAEITLNADCEVDLRVVFPNGSAEERRSVDICEVSRVVLRPGWTLAERVEEGAGPADGESPVRPGGVRFRNQGSSPVVELYADPAGAARGADRLGATVLGVGEALDFAPVRGEPCVLSVTAIFRDGREWAGGTLDLCSGVEVSLR
jgi:hypothetical protein